MTILKTLHTLHHRVGFFKAHPEYLRVSPDASVELVKRISKSVKTIKKRVKMNFSKMVEGRRAAGAPAPGENGERPSGAPSFQVIQKKPPRRKKICHATLHTSKPLYSVFGSRAHCGWAYFKESF
jgi:hypothetical protein